VRRTVLLANACGLAVGLLVLAGCGDEGLEAGIDGAVDRVQQLEDEVVALEQLLTTSTTAVPPPATLATAPPTTRAPSAPTSTTTTETTQLAEQITTASESAIRALVGEAAWDASLPIPSQCVDAGSFVPNGELGANGGVITCTVDIAISRLDDHYRFELNRLGFPFSASNGESSFSFEIGSQASISGNGAADRTTLTIEQRFP
jgi:hypothetical protein